MQTKAKAGVTVGALRRALDGLPAEAEVVVYADWEGEGERPFGLLEERLYVCGYFSVAAVEQEEDPVRGVLVLDEKIG